MTTRGLKRPTVLLVARSLEWKEELARIVVTLGPGPVGVIARRAFPVAFADEGSHQAQQDRQAMARERVREVLAQLAALVDERVAP